LGLGAGGGGGGGGWTTGAGGGGGGGWTTGAGGGGGGGWTTGAGGGGGHFMVVPKQPSRSTQGPGLQSSGAMHPSRGAHEGSPSGIKRPLI
jgi:hypothetical protein